MLHSHAISVQTLGPSFSAASVPVDPIRRIAPAKITPMNRIVTTEIGFLVIFKYYLEYRPFSPLANYTNLRQHVNEKLLQRTYAQKSLAERRGIN